MEWPFVINHRPHMEVMEVCNYWEVIAPTATGKCLLGPNSYKRDKKILDSGLGALHKVLEAFMGEARWQAKPTQG